MGRILAGAVLALSSLLATTSAFAVPIAYTSRAAFDTALGAAGLSPSTLDFDATAAGTTIGTGSSLGGITFVYDFGGVQMQVSDVFDTTSSPNFLGTDDGDLFQSGDNFDLSFGATNAIGMFFISADEIGSSLLDEDIALTVGTTSALLDTLAVEQTLADGSNVFFLGLIDVASTFTGASVTSFCCEFFFFNVDDIVTATSAQQVPAPGTLGLFGAALIGLLARRRRKSGRSAVESPAAYRLPNERR